MYKYNDVKLEPTLQRLTDKRFTGGSGIMSDEGRLDISVRGPNGNFWYKDFVPKYKKAPGKYCSLQQTLDIEHRGLIEKEIQVLSFYDPFFLFMKSFFLVYLS